MRITRREALKGLSATAAALAVPAARAQPAWPATTIRIVVPFAAGALTDLAARAIAAELSTQLGQQVIVENKGGAAGTIGTNEVAKSKPDGHTLVFTDSSLTISPGLYATLPYDTLRDLVPITLCVEAPAIMVAKKELPAKTVQEMVALAKSKPGALTYGSGGQGSSAHLAMAYFASQAGIEMTHVPFRGVAAALTDTAAGQIDLTISSLGGAVGHVKAGRVVPLGVTGKQRSPALPDVPTFEERGYPDFDVVYRFGFLAPAGTPAAVVTRLQDEIAIAAAKPKLQAFLESQGARQIRMDGAQYRALIERELVTWKRVITQAGVKTE
ncbi:MAG: tripartite tricarboxylate transporter substrate binding protein [Burkholderiales bacterium]|nr:tripartite tricarboxylate transporter substrate binding protein [Burkholderiales bacterium]